MQLLKISFILLLSILLTNCSNRSERNYVYKNGLIYVKNSDKLFSGRIKDTTDNFIVEFEVKNGKRNGKFVTYNSEGKLQISGWMKENLNEGMWRYYYPNGNIESMGKFVQDKPEGEWIFNYPGGQKKETGSFTNGKRSGEWKFFNTLGKIDSVLEFGSN